MKQRDEPVGVDFFAKPGDEDFDGARVVAVVALPDAFAQLAATVPNLQQIRAARGYLAARARSQILSIMARAPPAEQAAPAPPA